MLKAIAEGAEHIYLACGYTDFRKQIDGLAALVNLKYRLEPYSPVCVFLFCNRKRNSLKALRFERDGFVLATKKLLPEMSFQWPKEAGDMKDITEQQTRWLLEGLEIGQKKAHRPVEISVRDMCY